MEKRNRKISIKRNQLGVARVRRPGSVVGEVR